MAEIDFENVIISKFQGLISGYMAYCRASLIDLYLHVKFHSNRKKTCGHTDGHREWLY